MNPLGGPVGVLALQGDFARHSALLGSLGFEAVEVRTAAELDACSGLVMPGGESTTIRKGIDRDGLVDPLKSFLDSGRPILGTCAGMVLMGREHLGLIDMSVERNAYGRQIHSFETDESGGRKRSARSTYRSAQGAHAPSKPCQRMCRGSVAQNQETT